MLIHRIILMMIQIHTNNNSKNQSNSFPRPFIKASQSDNDVLQLNQVKSTPISPRYIFLVMLLKNLIFQNH